MAECKAESVKFFKLFEDKEIDTLDRLLHAPKAIAAELASLGKKHVQKVRDQAAKQAGQFVVVSEELNDVASGARSRKRMRRLPPGSAVAAIADAPSNAKVSDPAPESAAPVSAPINEAEL